MQPDIKLSGRQQLIYEACLKIQRGQQLEAEGRLELQSLIPEKQGRRAHNRTGGKVVPKEMAKATPKKRLYALVTNKKIIRVNNRVGPKIDAKMDQDRADRILEVLKVNDWVNMAVLEEKLNTSRIPLTRAMKTLLKEKKIRKVVKSGNPSHSDPRVKFNRFPYWEAV